MKKITLIIASVLLVSAMITGCADETKTENASDYTAIPREVKTTQFFTDEKVDEADVQKILEAGVNAPSAMNTQPWHFTAVTDDETAQKLADAMGSMKPPAGFGKPGEAPVDVTENVPEIPDGANFPESRPEMPDGSELPEGMPEMPENMPVKPEGMPEGMPPMPQGDSADGGRFVSAKKAGIGDAPLTIVISCTDGNELSAGLAVQNMAVEAQLIGYGTKIMTAPAMGLNTEEYYSLLSIPEGQKIVAVLIVGVPETAEENPDVAASATTRNAFDEVVTIIK